MKKFTFKRQLLFVMLMLLGCLSIQAADDGLITNQVVITLDRPGTLPQKINDYEKNFITSLKIKGKINGTDLRLIREMAGGSVKGEEGPGNLFYLDLSEAKIVSGGDYYYQDNSNTKHYTKDNEIGDYSFYLCWSIKSLNLPSTINKIGNRAFVNCRITNLDLPSGLISIGHGAFGNCIHLKSMDFPTSLTSIGDWVFDGCDSLTSLTLHSTITSIGEGAFTNSPNLNDVRYIIHDDLATYIKKTHPNFYLNCGIKYYLNNQEITTLEIPSNVISIGNGTFKGCSGLKNLVIPANVTSIGNGAFNGCDNLKSLTISSKTTSIGEGVFSWCNNLNEVRYIIYDDLATYIQKGHPAFYVNCGIKYYLKDQEITTLEIPSNVTSIGDFAFCNFKSLTTLKIPSNIISIGKSAFQSCSGLTNLDITSSNTSIGAYSFAICSSLKNLNLPFGVNSIPEGAFSGCSSLTNLNLPSSITSIGNAAFSACNSLTNIDLPSSITSIGNGAFSGCSSLTSINLPTGITSIGDYAFMNCSNLTSVNLPSGISSIGEYAFSYCSNLTNVDFPSSITSIGHYGFYKCYSLTNLTLPSNLNSIGDWAFDYCSSLTSLTINSNITKLGYSVFTACNSLKNLTFSTNVTSIADLLFFNSFDNLEAVYVGWQNPIEAGSFFTYIKISNCTLYVPQGTKEAYANADVWKDFGNIIEYDATDIDKVTNRSDVKEISRYSLNGQRVTSPTKGVNIVVYSDGSIKKVAVQ